MSKFSEDQLKGFLEAVKADASLEEKLKASVDCDAVIEVAKESGFAIANAWSEEQLKAFLEVVVRDASLEERLMAAADGDSVATIAKSAGFFIANTKARWWYAHCGLANGSADFGWLRRSGKKLPPLVYGPLYYSMQATQAPLDVLPMAAPCPVDP